MTYHIAVVSHTPSAFSIPMYYDRSPANDDFANAILLSGSPVEFEGTTAGATAEPGEGANTIWWLWRAPSSGRVVINVLKPISNLAIDILRGPRIGQLLAAPADRLGDGGVAFNVLAGQLYRIQVYSYPGEVGFRLQHFPNAPAQWSLMAANPARLAGQLNGTLGGIVTVESSPDLQNWKRIITRQVSANDERIELPVTDEPHQFYRLLNE